MSLLILSVLLQTAAPAPAIATVRSVPPPTVAASHGLVREQVPVKAPSTRAERWSILLPEVTDCPKSTTDEIIVCSAGTVTNAVQRLPLPGERAPQDRPRQPTGDPRAALENSGPPCPPGGCTGVNLMTVPVVLIRGIGALINPHSCCENGEGNDPMALLRDVGRKFRKKPDKSNRVPIVLDEPAK